MTAIAPALAVANAVLYEGYLLFPYTASSGKNRVRWQFGVIVPAAYVSENTGETAEQQTEVLFEAGAGMAARLRVLLRFLQVEARRVEERIAETFVPVARLVAGGTMHLTFDEGVEREVDVSLDLLPGEVRTIAIAIDGGTGAEMVGDASGGCGGRILRERWPLRGTLSIACEPVEGVPALRKIRVRVENGSDVVAGERAGALRTAFVSAHVLLAAEDGAFVSVLDPTPEALAETLRLKNRHVFPVLVGEAGAD
ncbi:MAG TPA: hypothetical protein VIJ64_05885, partial [Candidatus Lustribacter sp.]